MSANVISNHDMGYSIEIKKNVHSLQFCYIIRIYIYIYIYIYNEIEKRIIITSLFTLVVLVISKNLKI